MQQHSTIILRILAMLTGTLTGQGILFIVTANLLTIKANIIGDITTGYGISALLSIVADWGGSITQRQINVIDNETKVFQQYAKIRFPIGLLIAFAAIQSYYLSLPNQAVSEFIIGSLVGIITFCFNTSGVLDISDTKARHAYWQGLPATFLSCYLMFSSNLNPLLAGLSFSAGCFCLMGIQTWMIHSNKPNKNYSATKHVAINKINNKFIFREGLVVLATNLPGQIIARLISATLVSQNLSSSAGIYNFIKQSQGILNQTVTLLRRAEYNKALNYIKSDTNRVSNFKIQKLSIVLGVIIGIAGNFIILLFTDKLKITHHTIIASFTQSIIWLFSSSIFFRYQLQGNNSRQAIYSGCIAMTYCPIYLMTNFHNVAFIIWLEIAISMIILLLYNKLTINQFHS
jgi:hypothetical protein